jgi:hypothetical protein
MAFWAPRPATISSSPWIVTGGSMPLTVSMPLSVRSYSTAGEPHILAVNLSQVPLQGLQHKLLEAKFNDRPESDAGTL